MYNPVIGVQSQIANTLRGGLAELGNRPLEQAKFGLQKAQIEHDMARQQQQDLMQKTMFDQQQAEYKRVQDELNTPMKLSDVIQMTLGKPAAPDDGQYGPGGVMGSTKAPSKETISHMISNNWLPDAFKMSGVKLGQDGTILRADGTPVTRRDADKVGMVITSAITSKMDVGHAWNQKARKLEEKDPASLSDAEKTWLKQYKEKRPERLIMAYEDQIKKIESLRGPLAMAGVKDFSVLDTGQARAREKINRQYDRMSDAEKQAFEKWKTEYESPKDKAMADYYKAQATAKDLLDPEKKGQSTFEKEARFYASVNPGMTVKEAADIIRNDKTVANRLKIAAEEISAIDPMGMMSYQEKKPLLDAIYKKYELSPKSDLEQPSVPDWRTYRSRGAE